jgi:alpha-mannosidase
MKISGIVIFASVLALLLSFLSFKGFAQKRFYIAPDDHTDYYWLADAATYRQSFLTMIDINQQQIQSHFAESELGKKKERITTK